MSGVTALIKFGVIAFPCPPNKAGGLRQLPQIPLLSALPPKITQANTRISLRSKPNVVHTIMPHGNGFYFCIIKVKFVYIPRPLLGLSLGFTDTQKTEDALGVLKQPSGLP